MSRRWIENLFFIDSDHLDEVTTHLYGYAFSDKGLARMKNGGAAAEFSLDGNGAYDYVERVGDHIYIKQDFIGSLGVYIYEKDGYFALSDSLLYLIERVKPYHKLTFNRAYAGHLLAVDLASVALSQTIMNEIRFIGRDQVVDIDIVSKKISFNTVDYKENGISLDTEEGLMTLDKWYRKWTSIIRALSENTTNIAVDLSGGFDSRMSFVTVLGSGVDMNRIRVNSIKDTLHTHKEDYEIASQIADAFGFELNKSGLIKADKVPISIAEIFECSFYTKLLEHKQMYFTTDTSLEPLFFIGGAGGESLRSSHWDARGEELIEQNVAACQRFISGKYCPEAEKGMRSILTEALGVGIERNLTSHERSMLFYRNTRCRYHFGKDRLENYLHGRIKVSPLLDPLIQSLKLTTDDCGDRNLLPALIFSRYIPKIKEFPFDGGRKINEATWDYAAQLNNRYPYDENSASDDVTTVRESETSHFSHGDLEDKLSGREAVDTDDSDRPKMWYTQKDIFAYMRYLLSLREVKDSFMKVYDEDTYEIIRDDIERRQYHPFSYGYAAFAVALAGHYAEVSGSGDTGTVMDFLESHPYEEVIAPFGAEDYRSLIDLSAGRKFRVDIRNEGGADNDIRIYEKKRASWQDYSMKITTPKWFRSNGIGYVINHNSRVLDLVIESVNDGKLVIAVKGEDVRDSAGKGVKCYLHVLEARINGEDMIESPRLVWHSEPLRLEKQIRDGERVDVHIIVEHL